MCIHCRYEVPISIPAQDPPPATTDYVLLTEEQPVFAFKVWIIWNIYIEIISIISTRR